MTTRREFLKKAISGTALLTLSGAIPSLSAKNYANILGANDRLNVAVIGVNSRGSALAQNFAKLKDCNVSYICDVDSRALNKCISDVHKITNNKVKAEKDMRRLFDRKDIDVVVIATPDHWHAPAALMALKAGKHVYLEKPAGHTPAEGEMLIEGTKRYNRLIQLGTQRRSWPNIIEAINEVKSGTIGKVYFGKCWYSNARPSIGTGKKVTVPEWLDWELWQGPAPRREFQDNVVHYNWHWFWNWGTGEALNNGCHMIDLLRWGMDVDFPTKTGSMGGRYYHNDDWETPDTQTINLDFDGKKSMMWEGHSCNPFKIEGSAVGLLFYGEKGNIYIGGDNSYKIYDLDNTVIRNVESNIQIDTRNLTSPAQQLDIYHIQNFLNGIQKSEKLNADIRTGHISTLLTQLGNISLRMGESLEIDSANGHIKNTGAETYWNRTYAPGWEMKL